MLLVKIKIILPYLILFLFISFSCNSEGQKEIEKNKNSLVEDSNYKDLKDILKSKSKAVYLSFDTLDPDFGKIILIDLITKKSIEIVDNNYFNSDPIFFEDKGKILFASARVGDLPSLRVSTHHAWRQLYLIDCDSLFFQPYFSSDNVPDDNEIIKFDGLSRDVGRKQIYFVNEDNKLYKIQDYKFKPILLSSFDRELSIWDLKLSPNKKYLAIWYTNLNNITSGVYIYDISSNKIIDDIKGSKMNFRFLGWTFDNNVFCHEDSLCVINPISKDKRIINIGLDKNEFHIKEIYAESEDSIILLIDKLVYNQSAKYNVAKATEIARYNLKSRKIEWLTNDGLIKESLNVYSTIE